MLANKTSDIYDKNLFSNFLNKNVLRKHFPDYVKGTPKERKAIPFRTSVFFQCSLK